MVQITRHSSEAKATHFSAALLLWGLACVAILASSSRLSSPPTPSTTSLFSSSGASSSVPLTSFLHNAEGEMEALRASIPSAKPSEAQRLSSLFHNSDKSLQQVGNAEAARRASAQKRAVNAFSSAKHAAHRTRSASESSKEKSTARALHRGNEEAKMRHDVAASEERIKKMERQLPEAERRAFPTEARKVEEVLGKAAAQLDSINRKARRSSSKKTRKTQALHSGSLQAAKAADDRENSALAREEDASDVLSAVNSLPSPSSPKRSHRTSKVVSQKKGRMQDLAEVSDHRQWGKVYDPTGEKGRVSGLEEKEYDGWNKQVNKISSGYDSLDSAAPAASNVRGDWWKDKAYVIKGSSGVDRGDDDWWVHNHAGRGY